MVDCGEAVSERKRAFGGGQNPTLKKAVSEQRREISASMLILRGKAGMSERSERLVGGQIQPFSNDNPANGG